MLGIRATWQTRSHTRAGGIFFMVFVNVLAETTMPGNYGWLVLQGNRNPPMVGECVLP